MATNPISPIVSMVLVLAAAAGGCGGHRVHSPYAPTVETSRDQLKAQRLSREAAAVMGKNPARAEQLLREALTADLYSGPAHNNLGVIYLKQGMLYEAAGEFEWARKLLPGHPDPRMNLAVTLERAGRTDEALSAYGSALEVYPDHLPTLQAMTRLQVRTGRMDARTRPMLQDVALRGDTDGWRAWARQVLVKLNGN